jgi:hypothetical protein
MSEDAVVPAIQELLARQRELAAAKDRVAQAERHLQATAAEVEAVQRDAPRFGVSAELPRRAINLGGRGYLVVFHNTGGPGLVELFDCGSFEGPK